ncbi:hypothetical protein DKX38_021486 [Salix brachista]|uniref:Dienelactone hydrolase domain-containing protein n=1 Tax=Salix brachista TaxID=2182728 RepID=A0A5N5K7R6_9ROSI|nr:hypothetical protein DKX38_021486 [Salix brachista]
MFVVAGRVISVSSSSASRIFTASSRNPFSLCVSRFQVRAMADSASPPFKKIQIQRDDTTFDAYVVGKEDAPGIVVLQEWWGVDFEIKNHAVKISQLGPGFKALIPDLYRGKVGLDVAEAQHLMDGLDWQGAVKDIQASVNWLKTNGSSKDMIACRIEITRRMPFEPAWVLWVLLGACNIHGAVEMGNELGRSNEGVGKWGLGVNVKKLMEDGLGNFLQMLEWPRELKLLLTLEEAETINFVCGIVNHVVMLLYFFHQLVWFFFKTIIPYIAKAGVTGFCMGGALSIASSVLVPEVDAVVAFYGVPSSQLADPAQAKAPVQAHFGELDNFVGFSDVTAAKALKEKLKASGIPYEVHIYPGNAHAFMNRSPEGVKRRKDMGMPDEDEASAALAWSRFTTWMTHYLSA